MNCSPCKYHILVQGKQLCGIEKGDRNRLLNEARVCLHFLPGTLLIAHGPEWNHASILSSRGTGKVNIYSVWFSVLHLWDLARGRELGMGFGCSVLKVFHEKLLFSSALCADVYITLLSLCIWCCINLYMLLFLPLRRIFAFVNYQF